MSTHPALDLNLELLDQWAKLVPKLDEAAYTATDARTASDSIGTHLRHVLDFYDCFLTGLPEGRIDFDSRRRDLRVAEDRHHALAHLEDLRARLGDLDTQLLARDVEVRSDVPDGGEDGWTRSSGYRELQLLAHHAIHHQALVAVIVRLSGGKLDEDFGVAPSTLHHWKTSGRPVL